MDQEQRGIFLAILKFKSFFFHNQWLFIGIAWVITYVLCLAGIFKQFQATGELRSFWDPFYRGFQLFLFDDSMVVSGIVRSWELEIARFLAPAVSTYTAFTALFALFHDQLQILRLKQIKKHVVVCGISMKGLELIRGFREQGFRVVAIECDDQNTNIEICKELKVIVIVGDATDSEILKRARVYLAAKVVAITGNDGTNVEVAVRTFQLIRARREKIHHAVKCFIQVTHARLRVLFGRHPIFTDITDPFEISIFNIYENSTRLLFERFPLDHNGISKDDSTEVHLIIVGFGQMGERVLLQAAKIGHFANRKKIQVTVIDLVAEKKSRKFYSHYPQIESICPIKFIEADAEDPELITEITQLCKRENYRNTIVIALDDDAQALSCALSFMAPLEGCGIPVIVRMSEETGLAVLLKSESKASGWLGSIHPFGMTGDICNSKMIEDEQLDKCARKIHETYIAKRIQEGVSPLDPGLCSWERLHPDLKDSNRQQADHIEIKLRAVGCTISEEAGSSSNFSGFTKEEIETLAWMEHARWVAERLLSGWTPGPKEPGKRQSPYLTDWSELPENIREYDREAVENIPAILALSGKIIGRIP